MRKKGVSPVIATVLLISMALILVAIIFIWAKSWIGEKIQKDLGQGPEAVESFCGDISFVPEVEEGFGGIKVSVNNIGNIPLYGINVRKQTGGSVIDVGEGVFNGGLPKGAGKSVDVSSGGEDLSAGDEVIIVPIILGETNAYKKPYTCDDSFGKPATII